MQAMCRKGMNQTDAYREAYDTSNMAPGTVWSEACTLRRLPKVARRIEDVIAEIRAEDNASRATRGARVVAALEREMATAATPSARLRAAELLGKTVGLYRDVIEDGVADGESVAELEERLARIIQRGKAAGE